jgi:hypothetical protein
MADLEKQLDDVIRTTDHSSPEDRSRMIEQSQPILAGMRKIQDALVKERAQLSRLIQDALIEMGSLAESGSDEQILALLSAIGDLPTRMVDEVGFEWDQVRQRFSTYQQRYEPKRNYVKALQDIQLIG